MPPPHPTDSTTPRLPAIRRRSLALLTALLTAGLTATSCAADAPPATTETTPTTIPAPTPPPPAPLEPVRPTSPRPAAEPTEAGRGAAARLTLLARIPTIPTGMAAAADGSELLVSNRLGVLWRIRRIQRKGKVLPVLDQRPALDLRPLVVASDDRHIQRGLFDIALVDEGRTIATSYTARDGHLRVDLFPYRPGRSIDRARRRALLDIPWHYGWNHGGGLAVDARGNLLLAIGDESLDLPGTPRSQDPTALRGAVLRIPAEALAADATAWHPGPEDLVALGLQHPRRITIDPVTGDAYIGDVGNGVTEEIDRLTSAQLQGGPAPNFGWPYFDGQQQRYQRVPQGRTFVSPVIERPPSEQDCGIVAGYRYRGTKIPGLRGRFIFGDICSTDLRATTFDAGGKPADQRVVLSSPERVVSFGEGAGRELYVLGNRGGVYRLDPDAWVVPDSTQRPRVALAPTFLPSPKVQCGVAAALAPIGAAGTLTPTQMEQALDDATATLDQVIPKLPKQLAPSGAVVQRAFAALHTELAAIGYDVAAPGALQLRNEIANELGPFAGFAHALEQFTETACS